MNAFEFRKAVNFLLKENYVEEAADDKIADNLVFKKTKTEDGNEQINIEILGMGFNTDSYLILSKDEAAALLELAKKFAGDRSGDITKAVNTKDKQNTQSIVSIQKYPKDPLKMVLARKEGSGYKGYGVSDAGGYMITNSGAVYQLVKELPKYI